MPEEARLPRWLELANPLIVALQRRGVVIGTMRLLSVPGRKSGQLRTTPRFTADGERRTLHHRRARRSGLGEERAGCGVGDPGARPRSRVCKPCGVAAPGASPHLARIRARCPMGSGFFGISTVSPARQDEFEALAPRCPVFRVEEAEP